MALILVKQIKTQICIFNQYNYFVNCVEQAQKMFPYWNSFFPQYIMPFRPIFHAPNPQLFLNAVSYINSNPNISNETSSSGQVTKILEKTTQPQSKNFIQISSDSQQQVQQVKSEKNFQQKQHQIKKVKTDRFLGFKEGIFQKETNSPNKPTRNLRKRAIITRARLRKYKEKSGKQKLKSKRKHIQKPMMLRRLRQSPRVSKCEEIDKNRNSDKKPRSKQFGRLKKYLKCVVKTVDLPQMYQIKCSFLKMIEEKRQGLLLRKID